MYMYVCVYIYIYIYIYNIHTYSSSRRTWSDRSGAVMYVYDEENNRGGIGGPKPWRRNCRQNGLGDLGRAVLIQIPLRMEPGGD